MDDVQARAERYPPDDNGEVIYPINGRYMLQMLIPEIRKKQRSVDSETTWMHDYHKTIEKCNAQNNDDPGKSYDGELAEKEKMLEI